MCLIELYLNNSSRILSEKVKLPNFIHFEFDEFLSAIILIQFLGYHSEWGAKIGRIRIRVRKMCKQQWWFWLVVTLVFLNTCTVAVEHYGQPAWLTNFLGKLKVIIKS